MAGKKDAAAHQGVVLPVAEGEDPWTQEEIAQLREELEDERDRLRKVVDDSADELTEFMTEGNSRNGRDPADVGSSNFERDQEMALYNNQLEMLNQVEQALSMLEAGTYGLCEICGKPIGKLRLTAFPRATMCVRCKQREERR